MILVTAASGRIGSRVVKDLASRGVAVRALVRDAERGAATLGTDVEIVVGDLMRSETLDEALDGIDTAFLVAPQSMHQYRCEAAFIDAAQRAGLPRLVKLSLITADAKSPSPIAYWHGMAEQRIAAYGIPCTLLRANLAMQALFHFAQSIREEGALRLCVGSAKAALIDDGDIAAAAAAVCADGANAQASYTLTGADAIDFEEVARELSAASGQAVGYLPITPAELKPRIMARGIPFHYADAIVSLWRGVACGRYEGVSDDIARLTGRAPVSFGSFARANAAAFEPSPGASSAAPGQSSASSRTAAVAGVAGHA